MGVVDLDLVFRREFPGLVRQLRARFGEGPPEPEDAVQTAFSKLSRAGESAQVQDLRAFLYTTARNLMLDGKRRSRTHATYVDRAVAGEFSANVEDISPERVVLGKDSLEQMNRIVATLPQKQRTILALSRLQGLTYAEIAERTGYSMADISRQLTAALRTLRDRLEDGGGQ